MVENSLIKNIKTIKKKDKTRLHMPGANGKKLGFFGGVFKYEFTELQGLDNLFHPEDVIKQMQEEYADKIGARDVFYLVNGSTCGILSMLSLFKGKKLIVSRDFHVSCANAISMFDIKPVYVYPEMLDEVGILGTVTVDSIMKAYEDNNDVSGIYLTYPNYYGICADIQEISDFAYSKGISLILDAAHSAHFYLSEKLPLTPQNVGADMWTVSLHKTMPALNQTAYVATCEETQFDAHDVKTRINTFQTTSPSYLLLSSIEFACRYFDDRKIAKLDKFIDNIYKFEDKINKLTSFSAVSSLKCNKDPLKLVVDHTKSSIGMEKLKVEFNKRGIYFELIDTRFILFMLSPLSSKIELMRVYYVLKRLDSKKAYVKTDYYPNQMPKETKRTYIECGTEMVDVYKAENRVCASPVGIYPPGVPVLLKGDLITMEIIEYIMKALHAKLATVGVTDYRILVYKEK